MRTDGLRELCPHEFGPSFEVIAAVPPHVQALGRSIGEPRRAQQARDALEVELLLCKTWNDCQTELGTKASRCSTLQNFPAVRSYTSNATNQSGSRV